MNTVERKKNVFSSLSRSLSLCDMHTHARGHTRARAHTHAHFSSEKYGRKSSASLKI